MIDRALDGNSLMFYFQEIWTWAIPAPRILFDYKIYFRAFDQIIWILMAISTVAVTLLLYITNKTVEPNLRINTFNNFSTTLLSVFSVLINQPFFLKIKHHKSTIRLIVFVWLTSSVNFSSLYSSKIASLLTTPSYEEKVTTFEDLVNSGLIFGLTKESSQFFDRKLNDQYSIKFFKNLRKCPDIMKCLNRTATKRDSVTAINRSFFHYIKFKFRDEEGNYLIDSMNINIVNTPVEFLFQKNFPIKNRINEIMQKIFESGLITYWQRNLNHMKMKSLNTGRILNLTILRDIFEFLIFGWLASSILLIGEIFVFRIKRRFKFNKDRNLVRTKKLRKLRKRKDFVGRNVYKREKEWIAFSTKFK